MYLAFDRDGDFLGIFKEKADAVHSFERSFGGVGKFTIQLRESSVFLLPEDDFLDERFVGSVIFHRVHDEPIYFPKNKRKILHNFEVRVNRI